MFAGSVLDAGSWKGSLTEPGDLGPGLAVTAGCRYLKDYQRTEEAGRRGPGLSQDQLYSGKEEDLGLT